MTARSRAAWLRAVAAACLLAAGALLPAQAAELAWKSQAVDFVANDKPLADFLREVVATQGVTAIVDARITGAISGRFMRRPRALLDSVCATYGLTWYYDGVYLYVDPASETRTDVLPLPRGNESTVVESLMRLRVIDSRFPVVASERDGGLVVTGPKRYVDVVRQALKLTTARTAPAEQAEIRLFPLKYAWAGDVRVNRWGRDTVVPGVVSVLRSLYGKRAPGGGAEARAGAALPLRVGPTRQMRLSTGDTVSLPKVEIAAAAEPPADEPAGGAGVVDLPQFHADARSNAVLVRDLPERFAQYERLIAAMDTRPRLVEIEVSIMDVSSDALDSLGIDWRLHGRHHDAQTGRGGAPPLTWTGATTEAGQTGPATPVGGVLTAAIGSELRNFLLARVTALTRTGAATLVARPKVLALNNTEALLENLSQLNVRVSGFQDAGLFTLTAGTSVRITPLIVDEAPGHSLLMSIDIVDGSLAPARVDDIPVITRRTINTQAMVDENASLLIAGFSSEEHVNVMTGVPLLSSLPFVGALFRHTEKTRTSIERLYLLTPRLLVPAPAAPEPPLPRG